MLEITSHQMPGIDERQAAIYVACQDDAVAQIEHTPQLVIGQTLDLLLTEMSKLARGGIQLFHTRPIGRNPEFAILRLRHTGNIVGSNAGSILGIIYHAVQFAARDALPVSPLIIIKEAVAIKTP